MVLFPKRKTKAEAIILSSVLGKDKTQDEIQRLGTILQSGVDLAGRTGNLDSLFSGKRRESPPPVLPSVSIKNMPRYDPDAEIASLTLTVPTWASSIRRVNSSTDFAAVSTEAKHAARKELIRLKNEVESVLHHMKKEV